MREVLYSHFSIKNISLIFQEFVKMEPPFLVEKGSLCPSVQEHWYYVLLMAKMSDRFTCWLPSVEVQPKSKSLTKQVFSLPFHIHVFREPYLKKVLIHVGTYTFYGPLKYASSFMRTFFLSVSLVCGLNKIEITRIKGNILRREKSKLCAHIPKKNHVLLSRLH